MTNDLFEISSYSLGAMLGRPPIKEAPLFGLKIAALRKKHGLTQVELGEQLGVSQTTITDYERRTPNPSLKLVQKLAAFFDVSVAELLGEGTTEKVRKPTQLERAFDSVKALPRSKQKVIVEIIESFARANT